MKFPFNHNNLADSLLKKSFKLSEVKDKIVKVAFDVVRFKDDPKEELWKIESADGGDYIVALYEKDNELTVEASVSPWSVKLNAAKTSLNVFYKDEPLTKIAASSLGFNESDVEFAARYLPSKLDGNKDLVKSMLKQLDSTSRQYFESKFPELR